MLENKIKSTFCLSLDNVKKLEDAQFELRKMASDLESRNKITKSAIVDKAIKVILDDFNSRKTEGYLKNLC